MKSKCLLRPLVALLGLFSATPAILAQGTAFTYQGKLNDSGSPANGSYDIQFAVYDAVTNGNTVGGPLTNPATPVTNGLFSITLDFGPGVFTGAPRWLAIGVRTNGSAGGFTTLTQRQALTATPYSVTAGNLSGTLNASQLTGTLGIAAGGTGQTNAGAALTALGGVAASNFNNTVNLAFISGLNPQMIGSFSTAQQNAFPLPPMGLNTWASCGTSISEDVVTYGIGNLVANGLVAAGYKYYVIDDGWQGPRTNGVIGWTLTNGIDYPGITNAPFPHGIPYLAKYAKTNGMILGLYFSIFTNTDAGYPGSYGHVSNDVATLAGDWGIGYLKIEGRGISSSLDPIAAVLYTNNPGQFIRYQLDVVANAAQASTSNMFINASSPSYIIPSWMATDVNSFRGGGDATGVGSHSVGYTNMLMHFDYIAYFSYLVGPGHYVDPDDVLTQAMAIGSDGVNQAESIFSAYAMQSAPLMLDTPTYSPAIDANSNMIAVDQDPLVQPAHVIGGTAAYSTTNWTYDDGTNGHLEIPQGAPQQVWVKNLMAADGPKKAVLFLNRAASPGSMTINWSDAGIPTNLPASVFDCWANAYMGNYTGSYTGAVSNTGCRLLIITSMGDSHGTYAAGSINQDLNVMTFAAGIPVDFSKAVDYDNVSGNVTFYPTNYDPGFGFTEKKVILYNSTAGSVTLTWPSNFLVLSATGTGTLPTSLAGGKYLYADIQAFVAGSNTNYLINCALTH